jgi:hypothetical protein
MLPDLGGILMRWPDFFYALSLLFALVCFIRGKIKQGVITLAFLIGITLVYFFIALILLHFASDS